MEFESEGELEAGMALELYSTPGERAHLAAMMEHEGHAAAEAANEQEAAEHFLPLIPLAAKFLAPKLLGCSRVRSPVCRCSLIIAAAIFSSRRCGSRSRSVSRPSILLAIALLMVVNSR